MRCLTVVTPSALRSLWRSVVLEHVWVSNDMHPNTCVVHLSLFYCSFFYKILCQTNTDIFQCIFSSRNVKRFICNSRPWIINVPTKLARQWSRTGCSRTADTGLVCYILCLQKQLLKCSVIESLVPATVTIIRLFPAFPRLQTAVACGVCRKCWL